MKRTFIVAPLLIIVSGCAPSRAMSLQRTAADIVVRAPKNPEGWVEYGRACMLSNNPEAAEMAFRQAITLKDNYIQAYLHLGLALSTRGEYAEARQVYEKALQITDNNAQLWTAYGYCLADLGKNQEALEAFLQAINRDKEGVTKTAATLGAVALWRRCGNEPVARALFEQIEKANPDVERLKAKDGNDR